mmetsp:Transcript_33495/g.104240  ORF Transcript_33495/g.104240 Transcript_33495/m.104240 type:complete len:211 (-) Transcript_33495:232-864(-)
MRPMPALDAEPTPEALSSTATHWPGGSPTWLAARRYTSGAGLKRGGSKSDSPEWMCWESEGKKLRMPAASTQTGTRGLPEVVATTKLTPMAWRPLSASMTPGQGRAAMARRATVSSFCCCSSVAGSLPPRRSSATGSRPSAVRRLSTAARSSGGSPRSERVASTPALPAAARAASQASIMCSKALPAFSRTKMGHSCTSSSSPLPSRPGR